MKMNDLIISKYKNDITNLVKNNKVVIIVGQTGCGKSTQVPQYLHAARKEINLNDKDIIACLHPRSFAAINLAERVSFETKTALGSLVGYRIRFYKCYNQKTRIMYMTAGYMTRLLCLNKKSGLYGVVIIDEAHERSIQNDIIMGQMKDLIDSNDRVKLVIMSATMNVEQIKIYYPGAKIVNVQKSDDKILVIYRTPIIPKNYLAEIVNIVNEIILKKKQGHILIFLPNENKVRICKGIIKKQISGPIVLKFYSSMDKDDKLKVFKDFQGRRKIICATNVAETSMTIKDVNFVIDSGFVMRVYYNHEWRLENWITSRVSRAEADQRKGRTGRTGPGTCFRLFPEFDIAPETEILKCLKSIPWINTETEERQDQIFEKFASEFTLRELQQVRKYFPLKQPPETLSTLEDIIMSIKKMFDPDEDMSSEIDGSIKKQLIKCLKKVDFFRCKSREEQDFLLNDLIKKCSVAQLKCIVEKQKLSFKKVRTNANFFRKLENLFYEEGLSTEGLYRENYSRFPLPEIRFANLGSMVLNLKLMKFDNIMKFPFIVEPELRNIDFAIQHLKDLTLLKEDGSLTKLGSRVANLPLSPPLGKVAILGSQSTYRRQIFIILSMLSVKNIFKLYKNYPRIDVDLMKLLEIFNDALYYGFDKYWCKTNGVIRSNLQYANLIVTQFEQLLPLTTNYCIPYGDLEFEIKTTFLCGFFTNLAFKEPNINNLYILLNGKECHLEEGSKIDRSCEIIMPIILKMSNNRISMKYCTTFDKETLMLIEPNYFRIPIRIWNQIIKRLK